MGQYFRFLILSMIASLLGTPALAEQSDAHSADRQAIAQAAVTYEEGFERGDAKALAAQWTENGDYVDEFGSRFRGRESIERGFAALFAARKGLQIDIRTHAIRFITDQSAIEDGTTVVYDDAGNSSVARYTTIHVKRDGKWMLESVRESAIAAPSNQKHLRQLAWLVGNWISTADGHVSVGITCEWSTNGNFLVRAFSAAAGDEIASMGTQWIRWDPISKQIRSFRVDSNGTYGEGVWKKQGDDWVVETTEVLRGGQTVITTDIVQSVNDKTQTWRAVKTTLDGKELPDADVVTVRRID